MSSESKSGPNVAIILLIVFGALALLGVLAVVGLGVIGVLAFRAASPVPPSAPPPVMIESRVPALGAASAPAAKVFDRAAVEALVGKSKDDVEALLGKPAGIRINAAGTSDWMYHKRTRDAATGQPDSSCSLTIDKAGKVVRVSF